MNGSKGITGWRFVLATICVSLGTFLIALDMFIANVSIPNISGELGISQDQGAWVITSFTVANAIVVPLTGWLATRFGRIRLFCFSSITFSIASFLCGISFNIEMLLLSRVFQGIVSGSLIPLSQTLLLSIYPEKKKGIAIGLWGLVVMVGPVLGPVIGGWLTFNYGWPWIFFINVPIGIVVGIVVFSLLGSIESERKKLPIDTVGLVLFAVGIASLQIMLDKGKDLDWFASQTIVILAIITCVTLSFFIVWEIFHDHPVIDLSLFKSRNFVLGSVFISITVLFLFGSFVIQPLWVQGQLGYTPIWAGFTLAPIGIFAVIIFPLLGLFMHKIDVRIWIAISYAIFSATFFWYAYLPNEPTFLDIAFPRLIQGIAFALFFLPLTTIALSGVPEERLPNATGLFAFVRFLFLSVGISLSINEWYRRTVFHKSRLVESVIPSNPEFGNYYSILNSLGLQGRQADAFVNDLVLQQATTLAFYDLCYLAAWVYILMIPFLLTLRSSKEAAKHAQALE